VLLKLKHLSPQAECTVSVPSSPDDKSSLFCDMLKESIASVSTTSKET